MDRVYVDSIVLFWLKTRDVGVRQGLRWGRDLVRWELEVGLGRGVSLVK
jgi:hypothetical protein